MSPAMRAFVRLLRWPVAALFVVLFSAITGCADDGPRHQWRVAMTPSVPADKEAMVYAAAAAWEAAVPGLRFTVVRDVYLSSDERTIWLSADPPGPETNVLGRTQITGGYKSSQVNVTAEGWRPAVILHEMGHAMELHHTPCGIMQEMHEHDQADGAVEECDARQYMQQWGVPPAIGCGQ